MRKFPDPPRSAPVGIFLRDRFSSSSFGLIRVPVRFPAIPRLSIFKLAFASAKFSRSSRERTGWNFHVRSLPIFVILPNYGTCAIWCDSVTANFLVRMRALANSSALSGAHRVQIFVSDRFKYSSFCPNGLPVWFRPIPRRSIF